MGESNLGHVMPLPKGKWIIGTVYKPLNIVSHNENIYIALTENAAEPSDDGENWMLLLEGVPIAAEDTLGKVKPDGSTITVDEDGTMHGTPQVPESVLFTDDEEPTEEETEALPRDADMLNGKLPEYYATKEELRYNNMELLKNSNFKLVDNKGLLCGWSSDAPVTVTDEGVQIINSGNDTIYLQQKFDSESYLKAIPHTALVMDKKANKILCSTLKDPTSESEYGRAYSADGWYIDWHYDYFQVVIPIGVTAKVEWVSLKPIPYPTEYTEPDPEVEAVRCGVADYIPKQFKSIVGGDMLAVADDVNMCPLMNTTFLRMYVPSANTPPVGNDFYVTVRRNNVETYTTVVATSTNMIGVEYVNTKINGVWSGWIKCATDSDLAKYLPITGGMLTGNLILEGNDIVTRHIDGWGLIMISHYT